VCFENLSDSLTSSKVDCGAALGSAQWITCRNWSRIHVSSAAYHAKERLPRALSAREALQDLPGPLKPPRGGKKGVATVLLAHPCVTQVTHCLNQCACLLAAVHPSVPCTGPVRYRELHDLLLLLISCDPSMSPVSVASSLPQESTPYLRCRLLARSKCSGALLIVTAISL